MNREDIIRLAIEHTIHGLKFDEDGLIRFSTLVASAEREACAKVVDAAKAGEEDWDSNDWNQAVEFCASRIRARGQE
jgi:hypothetical protein